LTFILSCSTCNIGANSLLGSSTHVSDNAEIISSVVGQRCTIGEGSVVRGSYLFEGVVVEANCVIERSIIGERVVIKEGSMIPKGCLIGDQVVLGPEARLAPFERLSKHRQKQQPSDEDGDSELEELERSVIHFVFDDSSPEDFIEQAPQDISLGRDSNAIVWPRRLPEEDENPESVENVTNMRFMRIGLDFALFETRSILSLALVFVLADDACGLDFSDGGSVTSSEGESESLSSDQVEELSLPKGLPLLSSHPLTTAPKLEGRDDGGVESSLAESEFRTEVQLSLQRAFSEGHAVENAAVELKTLRMASNVPLHLVREAVVAAIVEHIQIVEGQGALAAQRQEISRVVGRWGELINKIGGVDFVETIAILQVSMLF
jgi:translation initiation factor eIF-2B subunit epsilon